MEGASKVLAVDCETTGITYFDMPFMWTIAWTDEEGNVRSEYFDGANPPGLRERLSQAEELVFHNAKFDLQKLVLAGVLSLESLDPLRVFDTECLAHLLDEHRRKGLKFLAREILGEETDEDEVLRVERRKLKLTKADGYDKLPREVVVPYALKDAEFTIRLHDILRPQVEADPDLRRLLRLEQRLTFVLGRMESRGMGVSVEYLEETAREYATEALRCELSIRDFVGDEEFNPNSPKQILDAFERLGVVLDGTAKSVLEQTQHPLARDILTLRTLRKMHGTYLKPMLEEQRDGILHPSYRQHGTRTGRMSSGAQERN